MPVPLGPHALKTYVRVREGSEKAMRVQWWAETVWFTFCNLCNNEQLGLSRTARSCMVATAITMSVRMIRAALSARVLMVRARDTCKCTERAKAVKRVCGSLSDPGSNARAVMLRFARPS